MTKLLTMAVEVLPQHVYNYIGTYCLTTYVYCAAWWRLPKSCRNVAKECFCSLVQVRYNSNAKSVLSWKCLA